VESNQVADARYLVQRECYVASASTQTCTVVIALIIVYLFHDSSDSG